MSRSTIHVSVLYVCNAHIHMYVRSVMNNQHLRSSVTDGWNVSLGTWTTDSRSHTSIPLALPAAMAAPRAVVSAIRGLTTSEYVRISRYYVVLHSYVQHYLLVYHTGQPAVA